MNIAHFPTFMIHHVNAFPALWSALSIIICMINPVKTLRFVATILIWIGCFFSCALFAVAVLSVIRTGYFVADLSSILSPLFLMMGLLLRWSFMQQPFLRSSYILDCLFLTLAQSVVLVPYLHQDIFIILVMLIISLALLLFTQMSASPIWSFISVVFLGIFFILSGQILFSNEMVSPIFFEFGILLLVMGYSLVYPFLQERWDYINVTILFVLLTLACRIKDSFVSSDMSIITYCLLFTLFAAAVGCFLSHQHFDALSCLFLPLLVLFALCSDNKIAALLFLYGMVLFWGKGCHENWSIMAQICMPFGLPFIGLLILLSSLAVHALFIAFVLMVIVALFVSSCERRYVLGSDFWLSCPRSPEGVFVYSIQLIVGFCCPIGMMLGFF